MSKENHVNRRSFIKLASSGGASAALGTYFSKQDVLAQEKDFESPKNRRQHATQVSGRPYKIKPNVLKRFDESGVAINVAPRELGLSNKDATTPSVLQNYFTGRTSNIVDAGSRAASRSFIAAKYGLSVFSDMVGYYGTGRDNMGLLSYNRISAPEEICNIPPDLDDPDQLAIQAKTMAKLAGADLVGICKLDRRWIYSDSQRNSEDPGEPIKKKIVFEKTEKPYETNDKLIIPDRVNNAIVIAHEQNRVLAQCSPSMTTTCASSLGYSRMAISVLMMAEYIRGMGYTAIPAMNGTGLSVPMAVDAGLGSCGRNGLLVTPEFGPNVRLCKVLTDMPLTPDKPIEFGVETFCETCKKCATQCPSNAISTGERSWAGYRYNNPGTFKWYNDHIKCIKFWHKSGTACMNCVAVCPFTKGEVIWSHNFVRWSINKKVPVLNRMILEADDAFGYGQRRDPSEMWTRPVATYGISPDRVAQTTFCAKKQGERS